MDFMGRHAAELLRDALALPSEGRAALIAWKKEVELRLQQIDEGAVELISWQEARKRLAGRLGR